MATMLAQYYVIDDDYETRHELNEEDIIHFFIINHYRKKGEIYLNNFSGIKLEYDFETGSVKPVSVKATQDINIFYSDKAFEKELNPITNAITLLSKIALLTQLNKLGDLEICNIIRNQFVMVDHSVADNILLQIQHLSSGGLMDNANYVQKIVSKVLKETGINHITSGKVVEKMMETILEALTQRQVK